MTMRLNSEGKLFKLIWWSLIVAVYGSLLKIVAYFGLDVDEHSVAYMLAIPVAIFLSLFLFMPAYLTMFDEDGTFKPSAARRKLATFVAEGLPEIAESLFWGSVRAAKWTIVLAILIFCLAGVIGLLKFGIHQL